MILFFLLFFVGFVTTSPVMKNKHFKVLKWSKCCHSSREYPLNSLQKVEETPTQQHRRALHKYLNWAANQEEQSRLQGMSTRVCKAQEKLQISLLVVFCPMSVPASERGVPVMPLCFEMLRKEEIPSPFFQLLGSHSAFHNMQSHILLILSVEICCCTTWL